MINDRVEDLAALVDALRAEGQSSPFWALRSESVWAWKGRESMRLMACEVDAMSAWGWP